VQQSSSVENLLLISPDGSWGRVVRDAWAPMGTVHDAVDVKRALRHLSSRMEKGQPYALVVLDVWATPDIADSISSIRQLQPNARIVVASAGPTWELAREAYDAGAVDFIVKPLDMQELRAMFARALRATPPRGIKIP